MAVSAFVVLALTVEMYPFETTETDFNVRFAKCLN